MSFNFEGHFLCESKLMLEVEYATQAEAAEAISHAVI